jgi:hypothetical protein
MTLTFPRPVTRLVPHVQLGRCNGVAGNLDIALHDLSSHTATQVVSGRRRDVSVALSRPKM